MARTRSGLISQIYRHTTSLQSSAVKDSAAITLMGTDVERIVQSLRLVHEIWASIPEVAIAVWLLAGQLGVASVVPVVISIRKSTHPASSPYTSRGLLGHQCLTLDIGCSFGRGHHAYRIALRARPANVGRACREESRSNSWYAWEYESRQDAGPIQRAEIHDPAFEGSRAENIREVPVFVGISDSCW